MVNVLRRIERLEESMIPPEPGPPILLHLRAVDSQGRVVSTRVLEVPTARPPRGRWRGYRGFVGQRGRYST
jgi:hypothetical protein